MFTTFSFWLVSTVLAQAAPAEAAWLKSVPAEADIVLRSRGLDASRADLIAMLRAMSPAGAAQIEAALNEQFTGFARSFGELAVKTPFLALLRVVQPDDPASPPWAVLVQADDYQGVLKAVAGGGAVRTRAQPGGYDAFERPGETWYAFKGTGFVAFGPDKSLIAAIAQPGPKTLDTALSPALRAKFFSGDLGAYVHLSALTARFAEQIEQAKQSLLAAIDQAGPGGVAGSAKELYTTLFDSLKEAEALVVALDFSAASLAVSGALSVQLESGLAARIAEARPEPAAELGRLPAEAAYFTFMALSPKTMDRLQAFGLRIMAPAGGKPSPETEKALALQREAGQVQTYGAVSIAQGMTGLNVTTADKPEKLFEASLLSMKNLQAGGEAFNFVKEVVVTADDQTYQNIKFTLVRQKLDLEKLAAMQPGNPAAAEMMKGMFGSDTVQSWFGRDDRRVYQVTARDWTEATARLDAYFQGRNTVGSLAGFQAVRSQLADRASFLMLLSVQGLVHQLAAQFSAMFQNPELKPPADMPREPAFLGVSVTPTPPAAYAFQFVVPSAAGPVFEKGLLPVFQTLQGQVNR